MTGLEALGLLAVSFVGGFGLGRLERWWRARRKGDDSSFSDAGVSVEVDCRGCGKFNRVPSHRLRDWPKCGQCKAKLMPGKRIVLCRVSPMEGSLRAELDALWKDEERLWEALANFVMLQNKARADAQDPSARVTH